MTIDIDGLPGLGKNVEMLILLFAMVCFFFLAVGAAVFVLCGLVSPVRRFALSAALWFAVWGPCVCGWMVLAGFGLLIKGLAVNELKADPLRFVSSGFVGWAYLWIAAFATAIAATVVAWLHQMVVKRFTFALFRIYAALVSAGVGSVWGWSLAFWLGSRGMDIKPLIVGLTGMGVLVLGFGYLGFRGARKLRGAPPERYTWVSREEFEGQT